MVDEGTRNHRVDLVARVATAPLRRWWLDVRFEGTENIPTDGGVVIAANHLSFIDSMLMMYGLERPVDFLGKADYLDSFVTRHLFPALGMIPVDRTGRGVASSLRAAQRRVARGEIVGIFPEGTRSRDGRLHRGHNGVAHLALRTGAPIVPAAVLGTDRVLPPGGRIPRRQPTVTIRFGAPIGPPPMVGGRHGRSARQALTDEVMATIAAMSGPEIADERHPIEARPAPSDKVPTVNRLGELVRLPAHALRGQLAAAART